MRFINTTKDEVLILANTMELLQQDFDCGRTRTRQHLDFGILWTIGLSQKNIPHIFFCNHGGLVLRQVISISLNSFIQVLSVLDHTGEVIHRHLHVVAGVDHR